MELSVFEETAELVRAMAPEHLGQVRVRAHRRGVKVWFDRDAPGKEHYEAQLLSRRYVDGVEGMAIEIGFHTEHKELERNLAVIEVLASREASWRKILGGEPEMEVFFGAENWRRVSEAWVDEDLDDPDLAFEMASRLVDYVSAIEPARS